MRNGTAKGANANHDKSSVILATVAKMDPALTAKMERAYYGERLEPALLQPVIDATAKYGVIPKSFPASEIIDPNAMK